jgi:hypothetical protein
LRCVSWSCLQVPARRPGLLLVFRDTSTAEAALAAIRAGRPRILGPPGGPPPLGRPGAAAEGASSPPPRSRDQRDSGRGGDANGRDGGGEQELPDFAGRTLWVGQVRFQPPAGCRLISEGRRARPPLPLTHHGNPVPILPKLHPALCVPCHYPCLCLPADTPRGARGGCVGAV